MTVPRGFHPDDELRGDLAEFWQVYDPQRERVARVALEAAKSLPDLASLLSSLTPAQLQQQELVTRELQRRAFEEGQWQPLLDHSRVEGERYARAGVAFGTWFSLLSSTRRSLSDLLLESCNGDTPRLARLSHALNVWIDASMAHLGEAYLATKEAIIEKQQAAIRELSTPVLQVREQLLIIPVVGLVDTRRARHLTESMLGAIRSRRARAVVMDITGVPVVDSRVASHLVQACEAARLMGARVILSGVSSEIAQALVTIGASLPGVHTVGDLQRGLEDAERLLASASDGPEQDAR